MNRRQFLGGLGGAAAWPATAWAQQSATPVIGILSGQRPELAIPQVTAFHRGLSEAGFVEGRSITIESRWANNDYARFKTFAAEFVQRRVALIAAIAHGSTPATLAAKAVTTEIPIVFAAGVDPVKMGVVTSLSRPGGNVTGVTFFANELSAKRLGLLHELLPASTVIAVLMNPSFPDAEDQLRAIQEGARALRLQVFPVNAGSDNEIEEGFSAITQRGAGAVFVGADPFLSSRYDQIIAQSSHHKLPAIFEIRLAAEAGGLISYGADSLDTHRSAGVYAGRILKGEKPADLPVLLPTKFELIINLKTAKALRLEIPPNLIARADEVIE